MAAQADIDVAVLDNSALDNPAAAAQSWNKNCAPVAALSAAPAWARESRQVRIAGLPAMPDPALPRSWDVRCNAASRPLGPAAAIAPHLPRASSRYAGWDAHFPGRDRFGRSGAQVLPTDRWPPARSPPLLA